MADAMKLVPVEPTEDMMACAEQASQMLEWQIRASWSAMLAASPPAREEAPAEGAGEWKPLDLERMERDLGYRIASSHFGGAVVDTGLLKECREVIAALRKRTSEPEAGAVAWLHTLHLELEQTFSRLTENPQHPFGKPGEDYSEEYRVSTTPLFTHPAPATADKLRVAVEALERIVNVDAGGGFLGAFACRQVAAQALTTLAALNEGGE